SAKNHDAVLFADGLQFIVGEIAKGIISERLPELVDIDDQASPVDQALDSVEEVHHQRRSDGRVIEQIRHVEADETSVEADVVWLAVEPPAEWGAKPPSLESGTDALAILLTEKGAQRPEGAFLLPELRQRSQPGLDLFVFGGLQRTIFRLDKLANQVAEEGEIRWRQ